MIFAFAVLLAALLPNPAPAQNAVPLGSSRSATAEPPVARPAGQPITVPLFHDFTFADYAAHPFSYTPPANHERRWAKIVLVCDFSVSAGRQFDRSAEISVGHTNIYFGTTAEPSDRISPAWHVERDLTEYAALLRAIRPGEVTIGNTVDSKYTGVIHGTAALLFYPAAKDAVLPPVPDEVLPLPAGQSGIGSADTPTDTVSATYTLPTNTVRAYLDLITESQGSDEFWYLSVPDNLAKQLGAGGGTAFREAEVTVDGRPAGVAPVFPWIYTGGIDPNLWRPIPGIQTLNFAPYRVNLTPFVGILNDGHPHTLGVRIENNQNHFQIAGVLLLFCDPKLQVVHGALTADTLTANPVPVVQSRITDANGTVSGPVSVTSKRQFTIAGYALTSAGKVSTKITQTISFSSAQEFEKSAKIDSQNVRQTTMVYSVTKTHTPTAVFARQDGFRYPLTVRFSRLTDRGGSASQTTAITQGDTVSHQTSRNGRLTEIGRAVDTVSPTDILKFNAAGKLIHRSSRSDQTYIYSDGNGAHYVRGLTAKDGVLGLMVQVSGSAAGKPHQSYKFIKIRRRFRTASIVASAAVPMRRSSRSWLTERIASQSTKLGRVRPPSGGEMGTRDGRGRRLVVIGRTSASFSGP